MITTAKQMDFLTLPRKPSYSGSVVEKTSPQVKRRWRNSTSYRNINIVVLGQDGVGKSAFTVRALTRRFIGEYDPNLELNYKHDMEIDGQFMVLDVLDTAGKNSVEKLERTTANVELFFLLYSSTNRKSFNEAANIAKYLCETKNIDPSCLTIVATKKDLAHMREVDEYEGMFLAQDYGCAFAQISISEDYTETMITVRNAIRECLNRQNLRKKSNGFFDNVLRRRSWSGQ